MMDSSVHSNRHTKSVMCTCIHVCRMWVWRAFKWVPVLLILSIVTWSYYAYVVQLCIFTITSTVQQCLYLIVFHILLFMFIWSYMRTIFTVIQPVPDRFKLPETEIEKLLSADSEDQQRSILENFAKELPIVTRIIKVARHALGFPPVVNKKEILSERAQTVHVLTRTNSGSVRYCNRCVVIKPDRAHHCSICARCVLKMDHHCPWVNNCVCYFNYKFFMLFLGYALLYCIFIMTTCLPYFIKFWKNEFGNVASVGRYHIVFAFFVSLMFGISLGSLFGYHCYLVVNNRTTLDMLLFCRNYSRPMQKMVTDALSLLVVEAFRAPMFRNGSDKNGFSIGCFNNFKEVFGNRPGLWLVPVFSSLGDGCTFPVRREHELQAFSVPHAHAHAPPATEPHGYESMGTTRSRSENSPKLVEPITFKTPVHIP